MNETSPTPAQSRVVQAARQILLDGEKPSQNKVREKLGDGTSNSTISAGLNLFWEIVSTELRAKSTQPNVPDRVAAAMNEIWDSALQEALNTAQDKFDEAKRIEDEAKAAADAQRRMLESCRSELASTKQELEKSQSLHEQVQRTADYLRHQLVAAGQERREHALEAQQARKQLDSVRDKYDIRIDQLLAQIQKLEDERRNEAENYRKRLQLLKDKADDKGFSPPQESEQ